MPLVHRRVTYKLYPTRTQTVALELMHDLHRELYNAALQERVSAWRNGKHSIGFAAQCKSLTQIRAEEPRFAGVNAQSLQVTLKRLDKAYESFFRRVEKGSEPGFPRFKPKLRFKGWGYKSHGDGFKFTPGPNWTHGRLKLTGVGNIKIRGEARTPGQVVSCDITRKDEGLWYASIVISCEPHRERSDDLESGLDWGLETFATLSRDFETFEKIPNERFFREEREALKTAQQKMATRVRGKRSLTASHQRRLLAKRYRRLANQRANRNHQMSAQLVKTHRLIVTEQLGITGMTRSARGTVDKPGKMVKQKAGLNREILDTAPADLLKKLTYKAEEAGCELMFLNTRKAKPSQRDPISFVVRKKLLRERTHTLPDGRVIGRDHAAGLVMLRLGLNQLGREPAWACLPETTARVV